MQQPEAYPVTYSILGLLAFWGPLSGYDIKRLFDHMLSTMWGGAAQSQIYKELRRMKELGWVDMEREEQEARPDRKVYSITEQGQAALHQWQAQPPEVFQMRDEMLLKVLFGSFADPDDVARNLRKSIAEHEISLLAYRQNASFVPVQGALPKENKRYNPYAAEGQEDPYFSQVIHFAIEFEKTYIRWLYETLEMVENRQQQTAADDHH
jgi:PadR family transcriptional regulator AphA